MEAGRVIELLNEGRDADLSRYAKGEVNKLMSVTFHFLCKNLIGTNDLRCRSKDLADYIKKELRAIGRSLENPNSNPARWFTQQYTEFLKGNSLCFRPEWIEIVHRKGEVGNYEYALKAYPSGSGIHNISPLAAGAGNEG